MRSIKLLCAGSSLVALLSAGSVFAQSSDSPPAADEGEQNVIVVSGIRGSVQQSIEAKRDADSVVDVITAEDIGKLPDQNVAESIARVPGVQITRRDGVGNGFTVRGISQNRLLLNGRVQAGASLESIGPEILSAVEVIKSPTADLIEGALGATVNLRTKRPLDMPALTLAGRFQGAYGDWSDDLGFRTSGFASWHNDAETFGALVTLGYNKGTTAGFTESTGGWVQRNTFDGNGDGVDDPGLFRPNRLIAGSFKRYEERFSVDGVLQFKPTDELEFELEGNYNKLTRDRDVTNLQILFSDTDVGGVASGSTLVSGTFNNVTIRPLIYNASTSLKNYSVSGAAKYTTDNFRATFDASYSKGSGEDTAGGNPFTPIMVPLSGYVANITYEMREDGFPDYTLDTNFDINNLNNYRLSALFDQASLYDDRTYALRFDTEYDTDLGPLKSIMVGARYEDTSLFAAEPQLLPTVASLLAAGDSNGDGNITVNELPGLVYDNSYSDIFGKGVSGNFLRFFPTGHVDPERVREALGASAPTLATAGTQGLTSVKDVDQKVTAAYIRFNFDGMIGSLPYRANAGVRYIHNKRTSSGYAAVGTEVLPVSVDRSFNNWLPSANFALDVADDVVLRLSAARVLANPTLSQVGAGIVLSTVSMTGSRGNPNLRPFLATQFDASLEWYFAPASMVSAAVFKKNVNSFTVNTITEEFVPGFSERFGNFLIRQPENGEKGTVKGFEIAYQHALTFLPKPLDGLGFQVAYTYADSKTPIEDTMDAGSFLPLPDLSKNSFSAIGYYEKDNFNLRLAYTWRDKYLSTIQAATSGGSIYTRSRGQLDASASWEFMPGFRLTADAINLDKQPTRTFIGEEIRLNGFNYEERRFYLGVAASF